MNELWDQLPGQQSTRSFLMSAADTSGGTYLFTGPRGSGKAAAARLFAAAILCDQDCGTCSTCSRVLRGLHPDVQVFQPEGYTYPVDLIREVVVSARQTPLEATRRVFIIEEADRIVERSQNALLKALEEPIATATWILVADTVDPFLPTVLSRCQMVEFPSVPEEQIYAMVAERFGLDDSETKRVVRASAGDLEKAIDLASGGIQWALRALAIEIATSSKKSNDSAMSAAAEVAKLSDRAREEAESRQKQELASFADIAGTGRQAAAVKKRLIDRHKRELRRAETDIYIDFMTWFGTACRDLAAWAAGAREQAVTFGDEVDRISTVAGEDPKIWIDMVEVCLRGRQAMVENANPPLTLQAALLQLPEAALLDF